MTTKALSKIRTAYTSTLIGHTDVLGSTWIGKADGPSSSLVTYPGSIPEHVLSDLLDWECQTVPMQGTILTPDGVQTITDPARTVAIRTDIGRIMGQGKGRVEHGAWDWGFSLLSGAGENGLECVRAGHVGHGEKVFMQFGSPDLLDTPEGVQYRAEVTFYTSTDGTVATDYSTGGTLVICDNQVTPFLRRAIDAVSRVKVKHSKHSAAKRALILPTLGLVNEGADLISEQIRFLCEQSVSDKQWQAFLDESFPMPEDKGRGQTVRANTRATLGAMYRNDPRCQDWHGTAFGVVQTLSTYAQHVAPVRGADRLTRATEAVITGQYATTDAATWEALSRVLQAA